MYTIYFTVFCYKYIVTDVHVLVLQKVLSFCPKSDCF